MYCGFDIYIRISHSLKSLALAKFRKKLFDLLMNKTHYDTKEFLFYAIYCIFIKQDISTKYTRDLYEEQLVSVLYIITILAQSLISTKTCSVRLYI